MTEVRRHTALGYTRSIAVAVMMAAAGALCACVELEHPDSGSGSPIVFESPIVEPSTKSDPFTTERNVIYGSTYPANWPFVVGAVHYDGAFADRGWQVADTYFPPTEMVYREFGGLRGWTSQRNWPKSGKLAFSAFSPQVNTGGYSGATIDAQGVKFTNLTLAVDGTQKDLLFSDRTVDQSQDSYTAGITYDGVQMLFHHALSSIAFTAKTIQDVDHAIIRITSIVLEGVKVTGSFSQNLTPYQLSASAGAPAWTIASGADTTSYANIIDPRGIRIQHIATASWESDLVNDLLVLPQNFGDATIKITYTLQTSEAAGSIPQSFSVRLADLLYTQQGETSPTAGYNAFEMGKRYVFNIEIGLQKIRFLPVVSSWGQTSF